MNAKGESVSGASEKLRVGQLTNSSQVNNLGIISPGWFRLPGEVTKLYKLLSGVPFHFEAVEFVIIRLFDATFFQADF